MALSAEKIAQLKQAHGPLMSVEIEGGADLVFKQPSRAEYDRWVDSKVAGGPATINARQLAQSCLVEPTYDQFIEILAARPSLLLNEVLDALLELAGVGGDNAKAAVKKL